MGQSCLILIFSTNTKCECVAYRSFTSGEYSARGVRKVTTGRTDLWQLFIATLIFDPSRRRSPRVSDCSPANKERELGLDSRETS